MSFIFFNFMLVVSSILRIPLSIILVVFKNLSPFLKARINFERKNFIEEGSKSFKILDQKAKAAFFISSEGEFEQVRPLIDQCLSNQQMIEIIFTSESVEKKIQAFYLKHPKYVRYLRLPLLSFFPFDFLYFQSLWCFVTAKKVFLCRYDFYPEILLLKVLFRKQFFLLSGAIKNPDWYKLNSFKFFRYVLAVTEKEKKLIKEVTAVDIDVFDLRIPRIQERSKQFELCLSQHENLNWLKKHYQNKSANNKLILGNIWPFDLSILNQTDLIEKIKNKELDILIVPHKTDLDFLNKCLLMIEKILPNTDITKVSEIHDQNFSNIQILDFSGFLCECYNLFEISYIGGGFDRSIHSVLEPVFSNSKLITGPKTHRSTEWDLAMELIPNEIRVLKNPDCFYNDYQELLKVERNLDIRKKFSSESLSILQKLQSFINED